jgi:hypothetical protein
MALYVGSTEVADFYAPDGTGTQIAEAWYSPTTSPGDVVKFYELPGYASEIVFYAKATASGNIEIPIYGYTTQTYDWSIRIDGIDKGDFAGTTATTLLIPGYSSNEECLVQIMPSNAAAPNGWAKAFGNGNTTRNTRIIAIQYMDWRGWLDSTGTTLDGLYGMFLGQTELTHANLNNMSGNWSIAYGGAHSMFRNCSSLISANFRISPALISTDGLFDMFRGCGSLKTTPTFSATTTLIGEYILCGMFRECSSLKTAPELPMATDDGAYFRMFQDCIALKSVPDLQATTVDRIAYKYMFFGCTSLEKAPAIRTVNLAPDSLGYMFSNCVNLNSVEIGQVGSTEGLKFDDSIANNWLNNVAPSGTFKISPNADVVDGVSGLPSGWTREPV